jgi:pSer/pThr/pTyr-binding forkhead associated (FHA) protein
MRCRHCGHENTAGANYCSSCGRPLPGAGTARAAEADADDTTMSLALIEDREALVAELGDVLDDLPAGLGMLVVRRGPNAGSTFVLEQQETTVGRHPDSDIFLDDVTVSRRHALITRREGEYAVADVGSLNGTYVDHDRIEQATLQDMQELQIGRFVLTFVIGGGEPGGSQTGSPQTETPA